MGTTRRSDAARSRRTLTRREVIAGGARLGLGLSALPALVGACGESEPASDASPGTASVAGTAVLLNYRGWMGESEVATFEREFPGAKIEQSYKAYALNFVPIVKSDPGAYDAILAVSNNAEQGMVAGAVQELDWSQIPNIKNVLPEFREAYPWGIPTDYGKTGIGYRKDLVDEEISSWADVWRVAPKYSGQIVFIGYMEDTLGSALKSLGYSGNSTSASELEEALNALIDIKPHLQSVKTYNIGRDLLRGSAAIVMDWDYDVYLAQQENPDIEWVLPEEGAVAYLEGWVALAGTKELDVVQAFMNFHLEPESYADFVNTTGTAYVEEVATPHIKPSIAENAALQPDPTVLGKVEFAKFLGEATQTWNETWEKFKSA